MSAVSARRRPRRRIGWSRQARRRARARELRRPPGLVLALAAAIVLVLGLGGWFILRDSSLVAVRQVTITGVSGPDARRIDAALRKAAGTMTTLDVQTGRLLNAVSQYPVVKSIAVSTRFPHGLRIAVTEQIPVAVLSAGGENVIVAGDGTLLRDDHATARLPEIPLSVGPGGTRVSDGRTLGIISMLSAAPWQFLARITQATTVAGRGIVAQLRDGPQIVFGDSTDLAAKWNAVELVLEANGSAGASYIDVTDPARPVAGVPAAAAAAAGVSAAGTTTTGAAGGTATPGSTGTAATPGTAATAGTTGTAATPGTAATAGTTGTAAAPGTAGAAGTTGTAAGG